jgi:hypothetical protein
MIPVSKIPVIFLVLAALSLVTGVGFGLYMGASANFALAPIHGHINLIGWVSLALFGLTYRAFPHSSSDGFARIHLLVSATAALLFPIGLWLELFQGEPRLIAIASILWLTAALQYAWLTARLLLGGDRAED